MDRKEFLSILGFGGAAAICSYCLDGCKVADSGPTAPTNVDFTLDLSTPAYSGLKTPGSYVYNDGVIVANTGSQYVALSQTCTHQGSTVTYDKASNSFPCPAHGSIFATSGAVLRGPAGSPLVSYKTSLTGSLLRVYS